MNIKIYNKPIEFVGTQTIPDAPDFGASAGAKSITMSTFNIDAGGAVANVTKKVDILFYNRTNNAGKIVSSVVYISPLKNTTDVTNIIFSPYIMYADYDFSNAGGSAECCTNFEWFNTIRKKKNNSLIYIDPYIETIAINELPMNVIQNTAVLDGWYTLVSAGVSDINTNLTIGSLYYDGYGKLYIATKDNDITTVVPLGTVQLGTNNLYLKYLVDKATLEPEQKFPQFVKVDVFIMNRIMIMINSLMMKDVMEQYDVLSKIAGIEYSSLIGRFDIAQLFIQSEEFELIQNGI